MAKARAAKARAKKRRGPPRAGLLPGVGMDVEASLLDVVDNILNKGVVLNGDLVLGVANVDLIYARLSALLSALDKVDAPDVFRPVKTRRKRKEGKLHPFRP